MLNEAKVYRSMGLHEESRDVFMGMLTEFPNLPMHSRNRIQEEIDKLSSEIKKRDAEESYPDLSSEELSFIRDKVSGGDDVEDILTRAASFVETGHCREALNDYLEILKHRFPIDRILGNLVECVLSVYGPDQAHQQVETILDEASLGKRERAQLKFKLGVEMERLERFDDAVSLYRSARMTIPEDLNMRSALDAKLAGLSKGSPYAYLLNQGFITEDNLKKAHSQAGDAGSSVESVLMDVFNIRKEDLGRSLSVYYGVPFKTYDPNIMAPVELLTRLDRTKLMTDGWVPLAVYEQEVEILMASPNSISISRGIQDLVKPKSLNPAVGIREDIKTYLERFYRVVDQAGTSWSREDGETHHPSRRTRKEPRYVPSIPDFSYVEFSLRGKEGDRKDYRLDVLNSSEHGFGLLLRQEDFGITELVSPGSVIEGMTFYSSWTLIRTDATIRHVTKLTTGTHKGNYVLGVESEEIIESSRVPG